MSKKKKKGKGYVPAREMKLRPVTPYGQGRAGSGSVYLRETPKMEEASLPFSRSVLSSTLAPSSRMCGSMPVGSKGGPGPVVIRRSSSNPVVFDGNEFTLIVGDGSKVCQGKGHPIERLTGILVSLSRKPVRVTIGYCQKCRKYFVGEVAFRACCKEHGPLLGNYRFARTGRGDGGWFEELASESVPRLYGYTVNKSDGLTPGQRRLILASLMDRRVVSQAYLIRLLELNIKNGRKLKYKEAACAKWESDLEWVKRYCIDPRRRFLKDTYLDFRVC